MNNILFIFINKKYIEYSYLTFMSLQKKKKRLNFIVDELRIFNRYIFKIYNLL